MNWEVLLKRLLSSRGMWTSVSQNRWSPLAMVEVNSSGLDSKEATENGSDSTTKSSIVRERSTLTRHTSGPNTITIRTMLGRRPSKEMTSNTMSQDSSLKKEDGGSSKENA